MGDIEEKKTHALSLQLLAALDGPTLRGLRGSEAQAELRSILGRLAIEDDFTAILSVNSIGGARIIPTSSFGDAVLLELLSRCERFPCPEGECIHSPQSFCVWCVRPTT